MRSVVVLPEIRVSRHDEGGDSVGEQMACQPSVAGGWAQASAEETIANRKGLLIARCSEPPDERLISCKRPLTTQPYGPRLRWEDRELRCAAPSEFVRCI